MPSPRKNSDEQILDTFVTQFESAKRAWKPYLDRYRANYKAYRLDSPNLPRGEREKTNDILKVPHVFQQIETVAPRLVAPDPSFELEPRTQEADGPALKALKNKIDYDLERDDFVSKQLPLVKVGLIAGVAVMKVFWEDRRQKKKVHNWSAAPMDILSGSASALVEQEVILHRGPRTSIVDLEDFFPDPSATCIEEMRYVFHRIHLDDAEVEARKDLQGPEGQPLYRNLDKVLEGAGAGDDGGPRLASERPETAESRRVEKSHTFVERWSAGWITTVADGLWVVRHEPNPYFHGKIPFVAFATQPDIENFVGIPEVEVIEPIQRKIHKMENLRIRAAEFSMNPVMLVNKALRGAELIKFNPGARIFVDRMDQIQQLEIRDVGQAGWAEVQAYLGYMQNVSGVSPYLSGADPQSSGVDQNTATGANILQSEANKRLQLKLLQVNTAFSKVAQFFVELNQQFVTQPEMIRVVGPDGAQWVEVKPEDIAGDIKVRSSNSTETLVKQSEHDRLVEALNTLMPLHGVPMVDGTQVDVKKVVEALAENLNIDPDSIFGKQQQSNDGPNVKDIISIGMKDLNPINQDELLQQLGMTPTAVKHAMAQMQDTQMMPPAAAPTQDTNGQQPAPTN